MLAQRLYIHFSQQLLYRPPHLLNTTKSLVLSHRWSDPFSLVLNPKEAREHYAMPCT
jgi:hypothetical protein